MKRILALLLISAAIAVQTGCGEDGGSTDGSDTTSAETEPDTLQPAGRDSIIVMPGGPMDVALDFSSKLGMNDPACFQLISEDLADSIPMDSLSPQEIFGRWRAFDAGGRLTVVQDTPRGSVTSYYCTIRRMEKPAISRIDFVLQNDRWLIDGFKEEVPQEMEDSLTIEQIAELVLEYPSVREEMHVVRMLYDDCIIDSVRSYSSMNAALAAGTDPRDFILDLQPESYEVLAECNIRRGGKYQIIKDRSETGFTDLPAELTSLVNIWREMAYLSKYVLRERHEAMQNLYSQGEWVEPDIAEEAERLTGFRNFFLSVSDIVERQDSLSRTWPVVLTSGSNEPLAQVEIYLDPHMLEQKRENDVGVTVWRALAVELNGDSDPERVVYWAGNLYLFEGTPSGYRLVFRTYENYESDYHADFVSQPSGRPGCREVTFTGVEGGYEYFLGYSDQGEPLFRRISSSAAADTTDQQGDLP